MLIFTLLEVTVIVLAVWFFLSQILLPTLFGIPRFPWFHKRRTEKLLRELKQQQEREQELTLEALRLKKAKNIAASEAAIQAAEANSNSVQGDPL